MSLMPTATDTPSANSLTINHRLISKDNKNIKKKSFLQAHFSLLLCKNFKL